MKQLLETLPASCYAVVLNQNQILNQNQMIH
jgi:hypothetical protein